MFCRLEDFAIFLCCDFVMLVKRLLDAKRGKRIRESRPAPNKSEKLKIINAEHQRAYRQLLKTKAAEPRAPQASTADTT